MYGNNIGAYRKTNVETADPKKLVIMCYDGAIFNLKMAKERYVEHNYEAKSSALSKAMLIIGELNSALDMDKGGDIAKNLKSIYDYMVRRLTEGDIRGDLKAFDEVIHMLEELGSAWKEIFYGESRKTTLPESTPAWEKRPTSLVCV
ncbi:MAG: flagellar export chaperone FliS [Desulfatibacillum sp.]|nr:flagellar export chaperone FliS [Desulfatibacillum sp.]